MYAITFFLCGVLAAIASAKTAATAPPFEVTQASIQEVTNGNTTFEFNVYDPDPLTNATAKCGYTWATGSNAYPQATYVCHNKHPNGLPTRANNSLGVVRQQQLCMEYGQLRGHQLLRVEH